MNLPVIAMRIVFAVGLMMLGCSVSAREQASSAVPDAAAVARYADELIEKAFVVDAPGVAVLVARGDAVLYRSARGLANVELSVPLSPDQVFRIGSVTKQFAAAALLKLVEAGKVSLSDPLSKYVADYPNGDAITVLQLLNHTSGVKSYTGMEGVMSGPIRLDLSTAALIDFFKNEPVDFAPGSDWAYNNSGYVLLGAVIEAASGMSWDAYMEQSLFAPIGLEHTELGGDEKLIGNMASGYGVGENGIRPAVYLSMTQPHAAGALVSTLDDLLRWNRALHGGRVLSAEHYQQMITPEGAAAAHDYGFGIGRSSLNGAVRLSHGGGIPGFSTHLIYLPESEVTVVVLQNNGDAGNPGDIASRLAAFASGKPFPEPTPIAIDQAALRAYEGVYRIDEKQLRELRVVDGALTSQRSGGQRFELIPIATDRFLFVDSTTTLTFERNAAGAITGLTVVANGEDKGQQAERTDLPLSAARTSVDLSAEQKQRVVGRYAGGPGVMSIFLEGDALKVQLSGQPAFDLFAESADRFYLTVVDATLEFSPGPSTAQTLTLRQGGAEIEFTRQD